MNLQFDPVTGMPIGAIEYKKELKEIEDQKLKQEEAKIKRKKQQKDFRKKRIILIKKYLPFNHRKHWDDKNLRDVILNLKDKKDLYEVETYCEQYKRSVGSIEWIYDNRESLRYGKEKSSNPLSVDGFARQIKRIMEEENLIR